MSGPYGPNDPEQWRSPQSGGDDPKHDQDSSSDRPTEQWDRPQQGRPAQPWGQPQSGAQPPPQWGQQPSQPTQQWGQPQQQPQQPQQPQWPSTGPQPAVPPQQPHQPQWGQQPNQPTQQWGQQPNQPTQAWGQPQSQQPQWGTPGQPPGQQWGASAQPGQPGQYGAPQFGTPPQTRSSKKPLILIGLGVLVLLVLAGIALAVFGFKDKLDQSAAQDGVKKVLSDSYGIKDVNDVSCPADQKVQKDSKFTCTVNVGGATRAVTVTFTDDKGTYEVGRPN